MSSSKEFCRRISEFFPRGCCCGDSGMDPPTAPLLPTWLSALTFTSVPWEHLSDLRLSLITDIRSCFRLGQLHLRRGLPPGSASRGPSQAPGFLMGEPWAQGAFTEFLCGFPGEVRASMNSHRGFICISSGGRNRATRPRTFFLTSGFFHDLFRVFHLIIKEPLSRRTSCILHTGG